MELEFWKYEGAGNDFVLLDARESDLHLPGDTIRAICDRHTGVGADGVMLLSLENGVDFRMRYYNADGSEAEMCGNGGRCIALFACHLGIACDQISFAGKDGLHNAKILDLNGESAIIELGMVDVESYEYSDKAFYINTGVPHYVEFVDKIEDVDVVARGRELRLSERFKSDGGTNANFVEIVRPGQIKVRTYERGVENETLACGTGAVACAIATHLYAQQGVNDYIVSVPGGRLEVRFTADQNEHFTSITLTGPARRVFSGRVSTGNLMSK